MDRSRPRRGTACRPISSNRWCHGSRLIGRHATDSGGGNGDQETSLARAQLELAEARAAAARAKAELAEAQARAAQRQMAAEPTAPMPSASTVSPSFLESALDSFQQERECGSDLPRPMRLLNSPEGSSFLNMMARLEETKTFSDDQTALAYFLQAAMAGLYRFVPSEGSPISADEWKDLPEDLRQELQDLRNGLQPEMVVTTFVGQQELQELPQQLQTQDWRSLARVLSRSPRVPDLVDKACDWNMLIPEPVERETGIRREVIRDVTVAFARSLVSLQPGSWTDAEIVEANRMAEEDERLKKVLARAEKVARGMRETVARAFSLAPLLSVIPILLAAFFVFSNLASPPPALPEGTDSQALPLYRILK